MLTNASSQASECWQGREDRGLCRSLALLNLMLTDSNEDGLLARIEKRAEEGRVSSYTSQDLLSKQLGFCMSTANNGRNYFGWIPALNAKNPKPCCVKVHQKYQ